MTFTHKLSRRIALLKHRRAVVVAVALVAAIADCERPVSVAGPGTTLAQLVVVPPTVSLLENASTDFVALGLTTAGDTVAVAVNWTANGGQISDSTGSTGLHYGVYTAGAQAGQFNVVAHDPASGKSATATAVVTATAAPVASVVVLPGAATTSVGGTTQFLAIPLDASGTALGGRVVTWASSNSAIATVDASGVATGVAAGSATITATSEGQSGNATLTVSAVTVPVASVSVSPASASVAAGQTVQLTATPKDANGNALTGRTITWGSGTTSVATVSASGLVTGVAAGSATITATSEGKSGSSAITVTAVTVPVATVSVSPATGTVFVGQTLQLTATPKDANGNALTGRTITWASSASSVAAVNGSGLVTGQGTGSATVTATSEGKSGSAAITVTTAPPPPTGTCLSQTGPLVTLSGLQTSTYEPSNLADFTRIDATTAQFLLDTSVNVIAREGGGANICWSGGEILGQFPPSTAWNTMHDKYAMIPGSHSSAVRITIENYTAFSWGKGISFDDPGIDSGFTIRNVHVKYGRDDCIEDDFFNGGTIDSTFLDGCYDAVSSQEDPGATQGINNIITISNSLLRLQAMDSVYSGPVPNHNAFWKWSDLAPSLQLYNNVFRADGPSQEGNGARMYMAPPPGKLADCKNNVMVWLGSGPFPETLPTTFNGQPCFTLMTGAAGLQYWNNAVANWYAHHPDPLPDVAPPIVSLFSPGISGSTMLAGTNTLIATANDDRAVVGVQFQLNGQNIGAEVTQDGVSGDDAFGPTKYVLTWDSHGVANGTYTLTAVARDAAGHSTTSAGVAVTVSN
jgi:uncharacterized protein YjdB